MFRSVKRTKTTKSVKVFETFEEALLWLKGFCNLDEKDCHGVSTKERWGMIIFPGSYLGRSTVNVKYFQ